MRSLRILGYATLRALVSLRRRPMIAALTIGVMTVSLMLVGLAYMAERNVHDLSQRWGSGVQMIVYLDDGTSDAHAQRLSDALLELQAVETVAYVPPEQAMENLRASLGAHDEMLDGIEPSFLPASLEVGLAEGVRDLVSARNVIDRLEATAGVEDVEFLGNWVDDFTALLVKVRRLGIWMVSIAGLIGMFTIVATMRVSAAARSKERRVLELMGATGVMTSGPPLLEGALLGLVGAIGATAILFGLHHTLSPAIAAALASMLGGIELEFLGTRDMVQLMVFGVSLGAVGGLLTNLSNPRVSS